MNIAHRKREEAVGQTHCPRSRFFGGGARLLRTPRRAATSYAALTGGLIAVCAACTPEPPLSPGPRPNVSALFAAPPPTVEPPIPEANAAAETTVAEPFQPEPFECVSDDDCRYDPSHVRCGTNRAFNKQPPVIDQGIICYCEQTPNTKAQCAILRVDPAPCEGEASCAVRMDPRPHPIRADAAHAYQKPGVCIAPKKGETRRIDRYTTCERTNICTMHVRECR
ncbi:MAG: hypothetical protein IPK82_04845 [Polyangiaceae bacterium]|nr:hypothetical protein [Polyangiaceae bacterium]